jgi:magnesium chelatase family protein
MLARWLPTILPAMTLPEAIETTRIHSVAGLSTQAVDVLGQLQIRFQE